MPSVTDTGKNLWIASSDGDLERVKHLIENQGLSPNEKDDNTYTPMHAAASYGHLELLEYLIEKGGDINITDEDGDTPLFTVESVETARWMVDHGANYDIKNNEGQTPAEYLFEDHPEAAVYLQSLLVGAGRAPQILTVRELDPSSQSTESAYQTERLSSQLTDDLMAQTSEIMERAERDGTDPEEELREIVSRAVLQGWRGAGVGSEIPETGEHVTNNIAEMEGAAEPDSKRSRND